MRGEHKFLCSFCSSCVQRDYYYRGRLHREKKDWERKKEKCMFSPLHHRRPTTERRRIKRNKNETVLKFLLCHNEWMRGQHISLCSFCSSCGLRETSIGVDYTDFEEKDCERKKEKCMFSHHHHLRRPTTERRTIKKNFRGGFFKFH